MKSNRNKDIIGFLIGFAIIILVNLISSSVFHRFDLTSEKRYSLSEPTKELISNLEDDIFITVYLEGDFPASFKRLRNETKEMLGELQAYSNGKIEFEFVNPSSHPDQKERDKVSKNLYEQGLRPTDLNITDDDGISRKTVWPGAIVSYNEVQVAVQLLKSQSGAQPELILNQSIESLEYELAFGIKKAANSRIQRVAFIEGHGELNKYETADLVGSLREYYDVERVNLKENINSLSVRDYLNIDSTKAKVRNIFDLAIIASPDSAFSEKDKFIIDQYIMYGGKVIWLLDQVTAEMDSLQKRGATTLATPKDLNLDDQLFRYGIRINKDLVQDLRAAVIPVFNGQFGNQAQTKVYPWLYYPLISSKNDHPINKNIDVVKLEFASSIDTVGSKGLKKTTILSSSDRTKLVKAPTRVSLNMLGFKPKVAQFAKKNVPVAVLVEGTFKSVFANRLTSNILNSKQIKFKEKSVPTQQLFISDGNLIKNRYNTQTNQYYALGFDRYSRQIYGNKSFIINAINYLVDDSDLILSNNKSFKIRLLDTQAIDEQRTLLQVINTAVPILLIILIGLVLHYIRKRKYTA